MSGRRYLCGDPDRDRTRSAAAHDLFEGDSRRHAGLVASSRREGGLGIIANVASIACSALFHSCLPHQPCRVQLAQTGGGTQTVDIAAHVDRHPAFGIPEHWIYAVMRVKVPGGSLPYRRPGSPSG